MHNKPTVSPTKDLKWIIPIVLVCFVVFANSIGGEFVYDDTRQVVRNPLIQDNSLIWKALTLDVWAFKGDGTQVTSNYWRPTFTLWNILCFRLFGLSPAGWHVGNIALHAGATVLAYLLLRRWELTAAFAFVIALIFAVHPVHVESVAWIAGSPDLLFAAAFLGSLWFATSYLEQRSTRSLLLAIVLYALALGAKEIALFCLPIYYLLYRFIQPSGKNAGDRNSLLLSMVVTGIVYFLTRLAVLGAVSRPPDGPPPVLDAILALPLMFTFYLRQITFPYWISVHYSLMPSDELSFMYFWMPLAVAIAALAAIYYLARNSRFNQLAAGIFLLPLLPAMNATAFNAEHIVHDRYLYFPLLGALMLVVPFASKHLADRKLLAAGAIVSLLFAVQTWRYNQAWASDLSLWTHNHQFDNSPFALAMYATALAESGQNEKAIEPFTRSIEGRARARSYLGRGRAYLALKRYPEAETDLAAVLKFPDEDLDIYAVYQAYEGLAVAYSEQRKYPDAVRSITLARAELPLYSASLTEKLAIVLYQAGQKAEALRELEAAIPQARRELLPESKAVFFRLGLLYAEQGRRDDARNALNEFLRLSSTFIDKGSIQNREHAARVLQTLK